MKRTESATPQSGSGRCSSCSKEATNSCSGCLNAPGYGKEPAQRTLYCSTQCQRAHWSTHKLECKVLQTRKSLHRAATVLDAAMGVLHAKGEQAMVKLAVFTAELLNGLAVTIDEAIATVLTNETTSTSSPPAMRYMYKITLNITEIWAIDLDQAYPPLPWADYAQRSRLRVDSENVLGFHHGNVGTLDPVAKALEKQVAALAAARGGALGSILKGPEQKFQAEMKRLVGEMQKIVSTATQDDLHPDNTTTCSSKSLPTTVALHPPGRGLATSLDVYHIRPIPGKGQGMVAASRIPQGTRILSEAPIIRIPGNPRDEAGAQLLDRLMTQQLGKLDGQTRQRFQALHNKWGSEYPPAVGIAKTNALPLGHNSREAGIFLDAARINHSCRYNAQNTWNAALGKITIHAIRDIEPGEEIAISYVDGFEGYESRQARLHSAFGFRCACELCSAPPAERRRSDERRKRLLSLEAEIGDGVGIVTTPLGCLRKARTMLRLLHEEGIGGSTIPRVYYDAFQVAIANGDQARAQVFAERCHASRAVVEGQDCEDALRVKAFMENPSSHRLYGTTMKWKQTVAKVPRGLSDDKFENWLWKEKGAA